MSVPFSSSAVSFRTDITGATFEAELSKGSLITLVDGNHFVRPMGIIKDADGAKWVKVYDPAGGFYEQNLFEFLSRAQAKGGTEMVSVRPFAK